MRLDRSAVAALTAGLFLAGAPMALAVEEEPTAAAETSPDSEASPDAEDSPFGGLSFTSADEPIVVEADKLEFDYEKNRLIYRGSVHVVQGDLELTSKHLIVTFDRADELQKAQLNRVVAQGDVVITQGERRASGERAVFDQASRQLILRGDPVLRDGPNEVQGDRLTVYLDEGRSVVESSPKKRVSAVLFPGQVDGQAPTSGGPPPEVLPSPAVSPLPTGSAAP